MSAGTQRKNKVTSRAPCVDFIIRLDGGSGTPVILADNGDRDGMVDYAAGTNGVTDNGAGDHYIHLREKWNDMVFGYREVNGAAQTVTSLTYTKASDRIEVVLSADTAGTVMIFGRAYTNAEGK